MDNIVEINPHDETIVFHYISDLGNALPNGKAGQIDPIVYA